MFLFKKYFILYRFTNYSLILFVFSYEMNKMFGLFKSNISCFNNGRTAQITRRRPRRAGHTRPMWWGCEANTHRNPILSEALKEIHVSDKFIPSLCFTSHEMNHSVSYATFSIIHKNILQLLLSLIIMQQIFTIKLSIYAQLYRCFIINHRYPFSIDQLF